MKLTVAADFDGTTVTPRWPHIGKPRFLAIPILKWLSRKHILILWTCRDNQLTNEALHWSYQRGIKFHYINRNSDERVSYYGNDSRKISADLYLDDKAFFPGWIFVPLIVLWIQLGLWFKARKHGAEELISAIIQELD